MSTGGLDLFYT